jgi:hypothetical protein
MVELQIQSDQSVKADELAREYYVDTQFQSDAAIGEQAPIPPGIHDIELSWDRRKGYMRIIIGDQRWWFKEYLGKAQLVKTDNEKGRLHLRAMAILNGETLYMYRDPQAQPHPLVQGEVREATHNRLCYWRERRMWRLRDERATQKNQMDLDALKYVSSYVGDLSAEWDKRDTVAHIYHNGWSVLETQPDGKLVAHLYDPDLEYGD